MRTFKLPSAAACQITVTGTATSLFALIATAHGGDPELPEDMNAIFLKVRDGNINYLFDGNTPTSALGILVEQGQYDNGVQGAVIKNMELISVSGNVKVDIQLGWTTL